MKAFLLLATLAYFSQSFGTEAATTGVKTPTVDFGIGSAGGSFYNQYRASLENEKKEFAKDKERYDQRKFLMEERGMAAAAGKPPIEIKGDLQRGDQWSTRDIIESVLNRKTEVGLLELNQADFSKFENDVRSGKYKLLKYRNIIKIEDNPVKMLIAITNGYPKGESMKFLDNLKTHAPQYLRKYQYERQQEEIRYEKFQREKRLNPHLFDGATQ